MDERVEIAQNCSNRSGDQIPFFICNVCQISFPTHRGMKVHRNRHANEANKSTSQQIVSNLRSSRKFDLETEKEGTGPPKHTGELDSECNDWDEIFKTYEASETIDEISFDRDVTSFSKFLFKANEKMSGPKHPAVKFYRLRHDRKKELTHNTTYWSIIIEGVTT
ncbi:hypothetical protein Bhyg_16420 [Pseudolycoriella hygida]|uniref:C2H2-type domain-containing protein n=1 Tax=Pseudolycoriella hygida TaxID=35572 RepID=A0A9Q0MKQ3_9DIPT|nr:hypothetical protein Bhyg_16420 [Pseudolycoriella hygida]